MSVTLEHAIATMTRVVARDTLAWWQRDWEDYPDIGDDDWQEINARVKALLEGPFAVTTEDENQSCALLKERADEWDRQARDGG